MVVMLKLVQSLFINVASEIFSFKDMITLDNQVIFISYTASVCRYYQKYPSKSSNYDRYIMY